METLHPQSGDTLHKWGYSFTWTEHHLPRAHTEPLRQQYDILGAEALGKLQVIGASLLAESQARGTPAPSNDLYTLLKHHHHTDETLTKFWDETHTVPEWVDWEQLARGQRIFYRYAIANIVGFALQGFVAENSAAPGVVEVLIRTGGFSTRTLLTRLIETFQWLIQVTHSIDAIKPHGAGHTSTLRVRLLHASVRQRILALAKRSPGYFSTETYGIPVNTLDSIHSITTFACNPLFIQLPTLGITPSRQETEDYVALFRYLARLLGTPSSPYFETVEMARATMESMLAHELRTTETSRVVAFNFVECVANLPAPVYVSRGFIEAGSRWVNGDELCDELELGRPGVVSYVAFGGCWVVIWGLSWVQWLVPRVDRGVIRFFRQLMYRHIVLRERSRFDFKYVPQQGKHTGKEKYIGSESRDEGVRGLYGILPDMGSFEMFFVLVVVMLVGMLVGGCVWLDRLRR